MSPAPRVSKKKRGEKMLAKLRREGKAEDIATIEKLAARLRQSEQDVETSSDIDDILDNMDEGPAEVPGSGQPDGQSNTGSSQQAAGTENPHQGLTQQASPPAQEGQVGGDNQAIGDQIQQQTTPAQQGAQDATANEQIQADAQRSRQHESAQQDNAQQNGAQQDRAQQVKVKKPPFIIKLEPEDDTSPLFVPERTEEEDPEYGSPLFSPPNSRTKDDMTTVGWTGMRGTKFINRYGKRSAARYRINGFCDNHYDDNDLPKEDDVSCEDNRLGDQKMGRKWKYTRRHIKAIYGVAWMIEAGYPSKQDLKLIDPEVTRTGRWVRTHILVAWEIPDEDGDLFVTMKWETRSTLRARWGNKQADKAIYQAACEAENRYEEGTTGRRVPADRTPSVGLNAEFMDVMRQQSLGVPHSSASEPARSVASGRSVDAQGSIRAEFLEWRQNYLLMEDVGKFSDLSDKGKLDMMRAWELKKASLI